MLFVLLGLCAYFVVSSGWFFKRFVLDRISSAWACRIVAEQVKWSPAAGAELRGVKVTALNGEFIAMFDRLELTFANPLLNGKWEISEIQMDRPAVSVKRVDGISNIDPIRAAINTLLRQKKTGERNWDQWAVRVTVRDGEFQLHDTSGGVTSRIDCSAINITGAKVENRRDIHIGAKTSISLGIPTNDVTGDRVEFRSVLAADVSLADDFQLGAIKLDAVIESPRCGGQLAALNATRVAVNATGKGEFIDRLRLHVSDSDGEVADISGSGQFNWRTLDGAIEFETHSKGPRWQRLYSWLTGLDLDAETVRVRGAVGSDGGKQAVVFRGEYKAESARVFVGDVDRKGLELTGGFAVDLRAKTGLRLDEITVQATRPDGAKLSARLMEPWALNHPNAKASASKWLFVLNGIPISEAVTFKTNTVTSGKINAEVMTTFGLENGGIAFDGAGEIREFGTSVLGHSVSNLVLSVKTRGRQQSAKVKFAALHIECAEKEERLLRLDFSGDHDTARQSWDGVGAIELSPSGLKHIAPTNRLPIEFTRLSFDGQLKAAFDDSTGGTNSINGKVEWTGSLSGKQKLLIAGKLATDASLTSAGRLDVRDATGSFTLADKPAALFAFSGSADLKASSGKFTARKFELGKPMIGWIREHIPRFSDVDAQSARFEGVLGRTADGRFKADGNLGFDGPVLKIQQAALAVTSCEAVIQGEMARTNSAWVGRLTKLDAKFLNEAKPAGQVMLDGSFEDNGRRGHLMFRAADVARPLFEPWLSRLGPSIKIDGGKLQARGNWDWGLTNRIESAGKLDSFGLQVDGRKSDGSNLALTYEVIGRFPKTDGADSTGQIEKLELGLSGAENFSGNIGGVISMKPGQAPFAFEVRQFEAAAATLELFSGINLTPLADDRGRIKPREVSVTLGPGYSEFHKFVLPLPIGGKVSDVAISGRLEWNEKQILTGRLLGSVPSLDLDAVFSKLKNTGHKTNGGTASPVQLKTVPLDGLALDLDIPTLKWKGITLTNFTSKSVFRPTSIEWRDVQASLDGSVISGGAVLQLPLVEAEHSIRLETRSLPLRAIAAAFGGTNELNRAEKITLKADFSKVRFDSQSILGTLSGRVIAYVEDVELHLDGPYVALARIPFELIRAPEILKEPIRRIEADITFDGGTVTNEVSLSNSAWTAFVSGRLKIADRWQSTAIDQSVRFSLSSVVAKKFKVPLLERQENFRELRSFYRIGGTIENPDFKIDYPVAAELFTRATVRRVLGLSASVVGSVADGLISVPSALLSPILKPEGNHFRMLNPIRLLESIRDVVLPPKSADKKP